MHYRGIMNVGGHQILQFDWFICVTCECIIRGRGIMHFIPCVHDISKSISPINIYIYIYIVTMDKISDVSTFLDVGVGCGYSGQTSVFALKNTIFVTINMHT